MKHARAGGLEVGDKVLPIAITNDPIKEQVGVMETALMVHHAELERQLKACGESYDRCAAQELNVQAIKADLAVVRAHKPVELMLFIYLDGTDDGKQAVKSCAEIEPVGRWRLPRGGDEGRGLQNLLREVKGEAWVEPDATGKSITVWGGNGLVATLKGVDWTYKPGAVVWCTIGLFR